MEIEFANTYDDAGYASAYARLEFANTYYLAYRDIPEVLARHVDGGRAIDFGCGAGRSTRFLRRLGYDVVGVDISEEMLRQAREADPAGRYRLVDENGLGALGRGSYDLVLSMFTFDNVPTLEKRTALFQALGELLKATGRIVSLDASPELYTHEWASFSTKDFPENRRAGCGDTVRTVITDIGDMRPCSDVFWPDEDYRRVFQRAGLEVVEVRRPLATGDEPYAWVNETRVAPWVLYVLRKATRPALG
jgi:SAM-dependent methyltransferase